MTGKSDRLEAKREEILCAASAVFREEGYDATSMDRIAERAGASKRTVYNHFGSKEALFEAVVNKLLEAGMASERIPWEPARPPSDQLTDFARAKAALADDEESMALVRVVLGVAIREPGMIERYIAKYGHGEDSLLRWLEQGHAAGSLRVPDPELAALLFLSMVKGALFWPAAVGQPMDPETRKKLLVEVVETFLARYRRVGPA